MKSTSKTKVIAYVRVSTEEMATNGVSLDAQRAKLEQYADLYDMEIVEVVVDAGVSAKTTKRPGLTAALAALDAGKAEGLLVCKLDRLTRSVRDLADLLEGWFGTRFALHSLGERVDTSSAAGRMILNIMTTFAQFEREQLAERTSTALRYRQSQGQHLGGVPYGYEMIEGKLAAVEAELAIVDRIIAERDAGNTWQSIADILNSSGIPTKRGSKWAPASIRNTYLSGKKAVA
jgi:site-specific DNA recombinase